MNKIIRNIIICACILFFLLAGYYAVEIVKARKYTNDVVIPRISTEQFALDISDLSKRQLQILLKVEDPAFFHHDGVDLKTPGAGITTITQALVKKLYFKDFRPGIAKIKQTLIAAFVLDPLVTKEDQLRLFINSIYLGNGADGFEEAAQTYYGKTFEQLTEHEYISLVAMIIAPKTFNIEQYPERNAERTTRIKKLIDGEYTPRGLCDLYYGKLDKKTQEEIAPFSYFEFYYNDNNEI